MRWTCPHCGVTLALGDDKMSAGWSFSRCFKCAGFALVRKAEVNIIKVDKAPPGERVLLPEATEEPMLGAVALQNQRELEARAAARPSAQSMTYMDPPPAPPAAAMMAAKPPSRLPMTSLDAAALGLPEPLPEVPQRTSWISRLLPFSIGVAALGTLGSGAYLVVQGQALYSKAQPQAPVLAQPAQTAANVAPSQSAAPAAATVDQVVHQAMAPERPTNIGAHVDVAAPTPSTGLLVRLSAKSAKIYQGPGLAFAAIAQATEGQVFAVTGWQERWFRIRLPDGASFGWIKNEYVSLITSE